MTFDLYNLLCTLDYVNNSRFLKKKILKFDEGNMSEPHKSFIRLKNKSGIETTYYSSLYEGLPVELEELARRKLNEKEEQTTKGIQELKEYMKRNHKAHLEDHMLLAFLRWSNYDVKNAESLLKNFLTKRQQIIKMLVDIETCKIENIIDDMFFGVLPYRDKKGNTIVFAREGSVNLERYSPHEIGVTGFVFGLFLLQYPLSTWIGFSGFGDSKGLYSYVTLILKEVPTFLPISLTFPVRISRGHVFNESFLCQIFVKLASPFLDERIMRNIYWHGSRFHELKEYYDPRIVPEEFGGKLGPLSNTHYKQKLLDFIQELKNEDLS